QTCALPIYVHQLASGDVVRCFRKAGLHSEPCANIPVAAEVFSTCKGNNMATIPTGRLQAAVDITESGVSESIRCDSVEIVQGSFLRENFNTVGCPHSSAVQRLGAYYSEVAANIRQRNPVAKRERIVFIFLVIGFSSDAQIVFSIKFNSSDDLLVSDVFQRILIDEISILNKS